MNGWANWAGNVTAPTAELARPHDEEELRAVLAAAAASGRRVRTAGRGHSFSYLVHTEDLIIDLGALCGVHEVDAASRTAWVGAGSPIYTLGAALWAHGLSLPNQGDIDTQSIGGAVATGTHGTGVTLGCLSRGVDAVRLVLADGTSLQCDADHEPELFGAARVSLGALGVITALRLRLDEAYHLHERTWMADTDACLADLDALIAATRHFEFFWMPQTDRCFCKALHPHPGPPDPRPDQPFERVDRAYKVFPSVRSNRFVEMEFAVPAEQGPACFAELRALMLTRHRDIVWPLEYRTLAADDTWIGPASGRPTVTLSVHQDAALEHRPFFADAEAVFRNHGGRPHWGKLHSFGGAELAAAYPRWDEFWSVADEVDPDRRFRNHYLAAWRP